MSKSKIEWLVKDGREGNTINFHTGCTMKIELVAGDDGKSKPVPSRACWHCYAKTLCDTRLSKNPKQKDYYRRKFLDGPVFHPERLQHKDITAKKPTRFFVNSMSDFFHEDIPDEEITLCWNAMVAAPQHEFLILTKRAQEMHEWVSAWVAQKGVVPPNIWLGVTAETRRYWDERVQWLRMTPAAVRFVSAEPLVERLGDDLNLDLVDWVIVGGESGLKGEKLDRMDISWAREIAEQCTAAGVSFFFKQLGNLEAHRLRLSGKGGHKTLDTKLRHLPFANDHPYLWRRETPR